MSEILQSAKDALSFCEMVLEIGMTDDTIIPAWPIETEMAITHPLTVGMVRIFKSALDCYISLNDPSLVGKYEPPAASGPPHKQY